MKRRLTFKGTIVILLFVIFIISFIKQELTMKRIQNDIVANQQELTKLKDENFKLQTELDNTPSHDYLEKLVRERLGMIKEGEKVVNSQKEN
ncbi:FtsB family cell division protein [Clostridium gasigenes]|uniref:Cell division protein FtsB n=1 Tax=Clostridium gasigenes TaxID=94869 RepID=A0A1H0TBC6_9CLOT|nr:septum formation initiator family protein [Clostridium gasigenes]MBB6625476.1 septum formation initiator family protein [Clostridium gasigenes]MBB6715830.1 septum formation initiator family protein [Clostridium gasigenes]MBU3088790.1 septum formation initiator family protein [Clostridium gasigenes]MBU3105786.1 septum formation initiator family protein [Clostridium gasigenes]MBU3134213.1 septum formation initiator family protein [Clostridium gasigenes]